MIAVNSQAFLLGIIEDKREVRLPLAASRRPVTHSTNRD